jgi:succinate dehydrogenase/fumarate reductase flavoprotein subunit
VRDEAGIETAIHDLEKIQKHDLEGMVVGSHDRKYNRERMEAIELPLMIRTALFVAYSASARRESRGSHYRTESPVPDDSNWLKNIVLTKSNNGEVALDLRPIA